MKETLEQKYIRLKKELHEMNEDLNERQKEATKPENLTSDFSVIPALIEHKIQEIKKVEEQIQKSKRTSR